MSLEDLVKASQRMTEKDFPQFPDPRVREVMAAAANLAEVATRIARELPNYPIHNIELGHFALALKTALFAAQHSKPKASSPMDRNGACPQCYASGWVDNSGLCGMCGIRSVEPPFGVGCTKCLRDGPENCWNHRVGQP